jgi:hypothetical protein
MRVARVYLRVSTQGQDLDRQESIIAAARDAGYYIAGVTAHSRPPSSPAATAIPSRHRRWPWCNGWRNLASRWTAFSSRPTTRRRFRMNINSISIPPRVRLERMLALIEPSVQP